MSGALEFFLTDDPERTWAEIEPHALYRWEVCNRYTFEGNRSGRKTQPISTPRPFERSSY